MKLSENAKCEEYRMREAELMKMIVELEEANSRDSAARLESEKKLAEYRSVISAYEVQLSKYEENSNKLDRITAERNKMADEYREMTHTLEQQLIENDSLRGVEMRAKNKSAARIITAQATPTNKGQNDDQGCAICGPSCPKRRKLTAIGNGTKSGAQQEASTQASSSTRFSLGGSDSGFGANTEMQAGTSSSIGSSVPCQAVSICLTDIAAAFGEFLSHSDTLSIEMAVDTFLLIHSLISWEGEDRERVKRHLAGIARDFIG